MKRDVFVDFMGISTYGKGKTSSGEVKVTKDLDISLEGADVLIVEDIVDSGVTLNYLMHVLDQRRPKSHPHRRAAGQARAPPAAGARQLRGLPDPGRVRGRLRPGLRGEVSQPGRHLHAGRYRRERNEKIMDNFEFFNPVKILFGKDRSRRFGAEVPAGARVLMTYGGGSRSGGTVFMPGDGRALEGRPCSSSAASRRIRL